MREAAIAAATAPAAPDHGVSFGEAIPVWARIAALSFGGPAGQIAVMHRILVEEKRWIGESRFLHTLNYCMLLPGPEATQLAVYIGWLLHKTKGGLVAGTLFVLPGFLSIMVLSWVYAAFGNVGIVAALFFGLKAAVLAIVFEAVVRIGKRSLKNRVMLSLAAAAFVAIFVFDVAFPLIVLAAGLIGYFGARAGHPAFLVESGHGTSKEAALADAESALGESIPAHAQPNLSWALRISGFLLALWLAPVALLLLFPGPGNVFTDIGVFFAQMAVVTFGGAYAVLSYVAQQAVESYGWLSPGEMLEGLGLAETTPGPLIMVTQFVGFLGAFRDPGALNPFVAGTLGGILTTWVTFVPCFLWIFLGAPFAERLRSNRALSAALAAITASIVGVILNLAVWFGLHVLFAEVNEIAIPGATIDAPVLSTINIPSLTLTAAAVIAVFRFKAGMIKVLAACSAAGVIEYLLLG
ncbi:chromate efflux transporter [Inquilinus sp. CAU 1745]|uniref:chromate efflux transporter n=1 Tax=Inquilinus sp. CAU 1745 TaxID=3140369 RepID=UPI00325AC05E